MKTAKTAIVDPISAYARTVLKGTVPAGKYHRLACERHFRDLKRVGDPDWPYVFNLEAALLAIDFFAQLRHYKGKWAGQPLELQPWQQFIVGSIFGWVHRLTGLRRFRQAYEEIPRKNGKSITAAAITIKLAFFDGEAGAEGYCAATKRDQARIVFGDAKQMVLKNPLLKRRIQVLTSNLAQLSSASKIEPLGADHDTLDGLNPHVVVLDELHKHKNRGLVDVMETAVGAREQSFIFKITTAGDNPRSVCGEEHDYAVKVLEQTIPDDPSYFAFIAHADVEDEKHWDREDVARKANPNYGISVSPEILMNSVRKAKGIPSAQATYKQKHLNLWVNADQPWLSMDGWRRGQTTWAREALRGRACTIGVDLSSKVDLVAVSWVFPPDELVKRWMLLTWFLSPDATLDDRAHKDRVPYRRWVDEGFLATNPGERVDQQEIEDVILASRDEFQILRIGVDPWNAGNLIKNLQDELGEELVVEVPQTYAQMSEPAKEFEAEVVSGRMDAGGNPIMLMMAANVVVQKDGKDNIYPVKKKSRGRIDGIVAAIVGVKLAKMVTDGDSDASKDFAERGLFL